MISISLGDKSFDLNVAQCFLSIMFKYCGNYRAFLTSNGKFDKQMFLESQPDDIRVTLEKIIASQMWSVFIHEREDFIREGKIESNCILAKHSRDLWHPSDLSVDCHKCKLTVTNNTFVLLGKLYCSECYEIVSSKHNSSK